VREPCFQSLAPAQTDPLSASVRERGVVCRPRYPRRTLTLVPRNEDSGLTKQGAVVSACEKEFRELGEAEV